MFFYVSESNLFYDIFIQIMYGITRIDNDKSHTHSWVVTISRKNKKYFGSFSDATYESKKKALAAAKKYRDEILSLYDPLTLKEFCSIVKRNSKSGISGVCRYKNNEPDKEGNYRWYWIATWSPEPGKTKQKKFSINKYGEEEAFHKAVFARKEALENIKGYFDPGRKSK
ncbi:MAG: AP2/ERF family transcription factor [Proteobacteria bacterium]|nr:AP2/ERF family transcription factor [Pseudomonadota bacterium]